MPRGRPHASWLRKVESYLKDAGIAGLAMARRRPKEYRRKVDAATRCSGLCPHTWDAVVPNLGLQGWGRKEIWQASRLNSAASVSCGRSTLIVHFRIKESHLAGGYLILLVNRGVRTPERNYCLLVN